MLDSMNHASAFSLRLRKEQLIHSSDTLIGSVPIVHGKPDEKAYQEIEGKMAKIRLTRQAVLKTWMTGHSIEYYVSTRVYGE